MCGYMIGQLETVGRLHNVGRETMALISNKTRKARKEWRKGDAVMVSGHGEGRVVDVYAINGHGNFASVKLLRFPHGLPVQILARDLHAA